MVLPDSYYIFLFEKLLKKEASDTELHDLLQWIKKSNGWNDWLENQWEQSEEEMNVETKDRLWVQIKENLNDKTYFCPEENQNVSTEKKLTLQWTKIVATFLLLILGVTSVYFFNKYEMKTQTKKDWIVCADKGEKANVMLPDGSRVWLNADSKLSYNDEYDKNDRILKLEGEAFFEVAKDKKRPFIVKTREVNIKALGTSFNVKSYPDESEITTTLIDGHLEIASPNGINKLNPNQKLSWNKYTGNLTKSSFKNISECTAWRNNQLIFNNETLQNIAFTLERFYNTTILFNSDDLKQDRFTGTLNNSSLKDALQTLERSSPIQALITENKIILSANKKVK